MEILTEPAKKYVDSDIKFKLKLPAYETRRVEGTFLDEFDTIEDGKTLITYKGNISQEGTPTPDNPIDVEVVTGYNKVVVSNKNLIDWANPDNVTSNTTYTFQNDILSVANTSGTNKRIQYVITNLWKNGAGKSVYCQNEGIEESGGSVNVQIVVTYNDGTSAQYIAIKTSRKIDIPNNVTNLNAVYIRVYSNNSSTSKAGSISVTKPMIAFGEEATDYIEHQGQEYEVNLASLELCKIGTYQDKIYRQNGTWYLHKEIQKATIVGNESYSLNTQQTNTLRFSVINAMQYNNKDTLLCICNRLQPDSMYSADREGLYTPASNKNLMFRINKSLVGTTETTLKAWLASNNIIVYGVMETPTDTEITNQALINQLEEIWESLKTYQEETIISQVNSDLPFYLDVLMEI